MISQNINNKTMPNLASSLITIFLSCFLCPHHACNQFDHSSLSSFFSQLSSPATLNWSSTTDCCFWEGIRCNSDGRVTHLSIPQKGLNGTITTTSLGNLTYLSYINLSHNHLSGKFPSSLLSSHVKVIDLSSNRLYGEISPSFFQLAQNIITFNISSNSFTGQMPSFICTGSSSVAVLDFSYNEFSGHILPGFGKCSRLKQFRAGFNNLSGSLPEDIYNATTLQVISLPTNQLSAPVSDGITCLTNLKILDLSVNQLSGSIPQDIGKLFNLEHLILHDNYLTGFLPSSLMNCSNLTTLNLRVNFLKGQLSKFNFSALLDLRILDFGKNDFNGRFPFSLYSCTSLAAVRLSRNRLEGQISPQILTLKSLSFLSLSFNNLTNISGAIKILSGCKNLEVLIMGLNFFHEAFPNDELDGFNSLKYLSIAASHLNGLLPDWLAKLKKLVYLDLRGNEIIGSIPQWLGNLPNLFYIDLQDNLLSGQLNKELFELPACASKDSDKQLEGSHLELSVFYPVNSVYVEVSQLSSLPRGLCLNNNSLDGIIPSEISQLKLLQILLLHGNNFSGNIPNQLSELIYLEQLDLSDNHLTGVIPDSLKTLSFLSFFSVANNSLQGQIPSGGQFDTFPNSSFEGNSGLCSSILKRPCNNQPTQKISLPNKSSNNELVYGIIAGVIFGLIVGITSGLLYPIHKLKFVRQLGLYKSIPFKWL